MWLTMKQAMKGQTQGVRITAVAQTLILRLRCCESENGVTPAELDLRMLMEEVYILDEYQTNLKKR
jgi:hypothetical protein